ncbi:MerC domain-containing protein [Pseudomonadota bacterium]|nr:MerC domain-containing protein [Pseudomonadota bacterium]
MIKTQQTTDKFAITLSLVCVLHCFFFPAFVIFTSGFISLSIDNEFVHKLLVLTAVPLIIFALTLGYKNHKSIAPIPIGILGLLIFISAVILGEDNIGEFGEKMLTLLGSMLVAYSHFKNYKICKNLDCACHEE